MVDVSIYSRGPTKIVYLGYALYSLKLLIHTIGEGDGSCVLVLLKGDNVVANTIEVVISSDSWGLWRPWVSCLSVLLILRPLDHFIKQVLEGAVSIWRLRTDMVCGASWESHCLIADTIPVELSVSVEPYVKGALRGAMRYFAAGHRREVFLESDRAPCPMHVFGGVSTYEVCKVFDRVNAGVALLARHETSIGPDGLWL